VILVLGAGTVAEMINVPLFGPSFAYQFLQEIMLLESLLRVTVTAGLAESNGSLPPGL